MLRRPHGLVVDHCKDENEEKNVLGLHGAGNRLLLPDYPFQLIESNFMNIIRYKELQ